MKAIIRVIILASEVGARSLISLMQNIGCSQELIEQHLKLLSIDRHKYILEISDPGLLDEWFKWLNDFEGDLIADKILDVTIIPAEGMLFSCQVLPFVPYVRKQLKLRLNDAVSALGWTDAFLYSDSPFKVMTYLYGHRTDPTHIPDHMEKYVIPVGHII